MSKKVLVLAILMVLLAVSAYGLYDAFSLPTVARKYETVLTYSHEGRYVYDVHLKPNSLYNTTILRGESGGTYFTAITKGIDVTFLYRFECSKPVKAEGNVTLTATLEAKGYRETLWRKGIPIIPNRASITPTGTAMVKFTINTTEIKEVIEKIEDEIGIRSSENRLTVKAKVKIAAKTGEDVISEEFNPVFTVSYVGNLIKIDGGLEESKPGSVTKTQVMVIEDTYKRRSLFIASTVALASVLTVAAATPGRKVLIEELAKKKFGDILAEGHKEGGAVMVGSLDDIGRVADVLSKPVVYDPREDSYRVYDGQVVYEFKPKR